MPELVAPLLDAPPLRRYGPPTTVYGASPAAATAFVQAVDSGYWTRLVSVFCRLVPDANAANREVTLEVRDVQDQRVVLFGAPVTVPASDTTDFSFSVYHATPQWEVDSTVLVPLGPVLMYPGEDFRVNVVNVQAGDQLSRIRFQWERFYPPDDVGQPD